MPHIARYHNKYARGLRSLHLMAQVFGYSYSDYKGFSCHHQASRSCQDQYHQT